LPSFALPLAGEKDTQEDRHEKLGIKGPFQMMKCPPHTRLLFQLFSSFYYVCEAQHQREQGPTCQDARRGHVTDKQREPIAKKVDKS